MSVTAFSQRLSELRKSKGLSQKLAASNLGVSQALLSHYEKGVRECGLDFLVHAADYYGVTTDYLLGIGESKHGDLSQYTAEPISKEENGNLRMKTIFQTAAYLVETVSVEDLEYGDKIKWLYALGIYRVIMAGLNNRRVSPEWIVTSKYYDSQIFQELTMSIYRQLFIRTDSSISPMTTDIGDQAPAYLQTLVAESEKYIELNIERHFASINKKIREEGD